MSLFRGKLFAGALYAGALFGALQTQPLEPPQSGGGAGQAATVSAKQAAQRIYPVDLRGTVYAVGVGTASREAVDASPTWPRIAALKGIEQSSQPANFAQNLQKTGVNAPETAHKAQVAPDFEATLNAQVTTQFEAETARQVEKARMADEEAALAMLAFMMSDDA